MTSSPRWRVFSLTWREAEGIEGFSQEVSFMSFHLCSSARPSTGAAVVLAWVKVSHCRVRNLCNRARGAQLNAREHSKLLSSVLPRAIATAGWARDHQPAGAGGPPKARGSRPSAGKSSLHQGQHQGQLMATANSHPLTTQHCN